jgi:hypothetical protein
VVSFSEGREELAGCHLKVDLVGEQYRPVPELLTDHLTQGVWRHCIFPRWKADNQQHSGTLDSVSESTEGISPEDYEPQDFDLADPTPLTDRPDQLNLESRRGRSGMTRAYAQIEQFSMKEREYGEGKSAFESYLATSLSRNETVPPLWGYAEDD